MAALRDLRARQARAQPRARRLAARRRRRDGAAARPRRLHPAQRGRQHLGGARRRRSRRPARTRRTRCSRPPATRSTGTRRSTPSPTTSPTCEDRDEPRARPRRRPRVGLRRPAPAATTRSGPSAPTSRTRWPASTPPSPTASTPRALADVLPDARRRRARLLPPALAVGQQRARPRGGHRAGEHRARPARPGPAAAGACRRGRRRPWCPSLPEGSPVPPEDALAFFRDEAAFRNVRFVEPDNGDFAVTIARLLVFSTYRLALLQRLASQPRPGAVRDRGQGRQGGRPTTATTPAAGSSPWPAAPRSRGAGSSPGWRWCGRCTTSCSRTHAGRAGRRRAGRRGRPGRACADEVDVRARAGALGQRRRAPRGPADRSGRPGAWAATAGTPRRWAGCWPRCRSSPAPTRWGCGEHRLRACAAAVVPTPRCRC